MNKVEEKEKLNNALKKMQVAQERQKVKEIFASHIGFENEKKEFFQASQLYVQFGGNLRPERKVICYSGPPGVGKTTFVQTLSSAMGRPLEPVHCAGLANPSEYSILGDKNKPSLVAWAITKNECKNPIILLDELEKVTDEKIQADLIKIFQDFKDKGTYYDPYFQQEISLEYIDIFAAVNYDEKLATKLKDKVDLRKLLGYNEKEKMQILQRKKAEIQKLYNLEKEEVEKVLSNDILEFLINTWIQEKGVRKLEQACHKIISEYVIAKQTNQQAFQGNKQQWIEKNVLSFRESHKLNWRHYLLFASFGLSLVLLITWIFTRFLLKKEPIKEKPGGKNE